MEVDTKFPKAYPNYIEGEGVYSEMDVDFWLKKCIEDFPFERVDWDFKQYLRTKGHYNVAIHPFIAELLESWFNKWFSQFEGRCGLS